MPTVQWYHFMKLMSIHIKLLILTKFLVSQGFLSVKKSNFSHYMDFIVTRLCYST